MTHDELVDKYVKLYKCSIQEAEELIADDEEVDKMTVSEINQGYSEKERRAIKQATKSDTKARKPHARELKQDKIEILEKCLAVLKEEFPDAERRKDAEINFNGGLYTLKLVKHGGRGK